MSATTPSAPFVLSLSLRGLPDDYTADLPAFRGLERLELDPRVTFFVGENGSGKVLAARGAADVSSSPSSRTDLHPGRPAPRGFYLLDEPEAALSVRGQLALIRRMHELVEQRSQFVVATHSPILLGYPGATIYELGDDGINRVEYEQTQQVELTRSFLDDPQRFLRHLLAD